MRVHDGLSLLMCSLSIMGVFMFIELTGITKNIGTAIYFSAVGLVGILVIGISIAVRQKKEHKSL